MYNFHAVQVIYTNNVSDVWIILYILAYGQFLFLFFFRLPHFEIPESEM